MQTAQINYAFEARLLLTRHFDLLLLFKTSLVFPSKEELVAMQGLREDIESLQSYLHQFAIQFLNDVPGLSPEMKELDDDFEALFHNYRKLAVERDQEDCDPVAWNYLVKYKSLFRRQYERLLLKTGYGPQGKQESPPVYRSNSCDLSTEVNVRVTHGQQGNTAACKMDPAPAENSPHGSLKPLGAEEKVDTPPEEEYPLPKGLEQVELKPEEEIALVKIIKFLRTHPCRELLEFKGRMYAMIRSGQAKFLVRKLGKMKAYELLAEICEGNERDAGGIYRLYYNKNSGEKDNYLVRGNFPELEAIFGPDSPI